ncbi:Wzz/FepE/Etk N-terminal domain-containing protein [Terriglobus sp. ADX1]|uniref:Wzz/FepE/Etk N-terminal domain-containing protein n=1 Tax=Terriglobus sp. ADX1 TaxID=2794063 RepID=UPI002FE5708A
MSSSDESMVPASLASPKQDSKGSWHIIELLIRRQKTLLRVTVAVGALALLGTFFLKPEYESTVVLIPPSSPSSGLGALAALAGGAAPLISESTLGGKSTGESYVSMFTSQTVEDAVIRRFHLMDEYKKKRMSDARKVLEKKVTVFYGARDGMIRLSAVSTSPQKAADLANGYFQTFASFSATLAVTDAQKKRMFYQEELGHAKDRLAQAEQDLKRTQDSTGLLQMEGQARALITSAASINAQIAAKQVEIRSLESFAATGNPRLITARNELTALQAQLDRLTSQGNTSNGLMLTKPELSEAGLEYVRRMRDVKYYETLFEMLAKQYEAAQLEEARQGSTMQVVDKATPPDKKLPQFRVLIVLAAACLAFCACSLYLILQDRWRTSGIQQRLRQIRSNTA